MVEEVKKKEFDWDKVGEPKRFGTGRANFVAEVYQREGKKQYAITKFSNGKRTGVWIPSEEWDTLKVYFDQSGGVDN